MRSARVSRIHRRHIMSAGFVALDVILHKKKAALRAGGTAGNVAANLVALGWNADVVGRVGRDKAGKYLISDLMEHGVSTYRLEESEDPTPLVYHHVNPSKSYFTLRCPVCSSYTKAWKPMESEQNLRNGAAPDVFYFDRAYASIVKLAQVANERGSLVMFEPSSAGDDPGLFIEAIGSAHIVKHSAEDAKNITTLLRRDQIRILTRGRWGVDIQAPRSWASHFPTQPLDNPVDTGGAGDWLTAGLLFALRTLDPTQLREKDVTEALKYGQAMATLSCNFVGARGMSESRSKAWILKHTKRIYQGNPSVKPRNTLFRASGWRPQGEVLAEVCGKCASNMEVEDGV